MLLAAKIVDIEMLSFQFKMLDLPGRTAVCWLSKWGQRIRCILFMLIQQRT